MKTTLSFLFLSSTFFLIGHPLEPLECLKTGKTEDATKVITENFSLDKINPLTLEKSGFTPLIGKNLDDWKIHNDNPKVKFTLKDGVISGTGENIRDNSFLYTSAEYSSYLLYFEFRFDHLKGNSGLMYHSHYNDQKQFAGLQYEMDPGTKKMGDIQRQWTGLLYAENLNGWIYPNRDGAAGPDKSTAEEMKQFSEIGHEALNEEGWNTAFIRIRGKDIQTWLNGHLRTNLSYPKDNYPAKGSISLQIHGGKSCAASWRNIYILPLKD